MMIGDNGNEDATANRIILLKINCKVEMGFVLPESFIYSAIVDTSPVNCGS